MIATAVFRDGAEVQVPAGARAHKVGGTDRVVVDWHTRSPHVSTAVVEHQGGTILVLVHGAFSSVSGSVLDPSEDAQDVARRYLDGGVDALAALDGEQLVIVHDLDADRLHVVSDVHGLYRVYWRHSDSVTAVAATLHDLLHLMPSTTVRAESVGEFLHYGYIPGPGTVYREVSVIGPSTVLTIDGPDGSPHVHSREQRTDPGPVPTTEAAARCGVWERTLNAVARRLGSDQPAHALLSAGYDSALCAAALRERSSRVVAHTIGFVDRPANENAAAAAMMNHLGVEHLDIMISDRQMVDGFSAWIRSHGQPWAHPNGLSTRIAYQAIVDHGTASLVFDGIGGDPLFCDIALQCRSFGAVRMFAGIPGARQSLDAIAGRVGRGAVGRRLAMARDLATYGADGSLVFFHFWKGLYGDRVLGRPFDPGTTRPGRLLADSTRPLGDRYAAYYATWGFDSSLCRSVGEAATVGLTVTSPFEDRDLWAYVGTIPAEIRSPTGDDRRLQIDLVQDHVPASLFSDRKWAMETPVASVLASPGGRDLLRDHLDRPHGAIAHLYDPEVVQRVRADFERGHLEHAMRLWSVLVLEAWAREFLT